MINQSQILLFLNIVFVLVVFFFVRRMLKAASVFQWNPGDNDVQKKQKLIILKAIVLTACTTLLAAILNAYFG